MSWRGEAGGIEAARQHHDVLMTPGSNGLYFDHKQSNSPDEPITIGGFSNVEKVYNYNPVPSVLTPEQAKYIKGVQANLWTEYIKTPEKAEYMLFPRVYALAEIAWTPVQRKNFDNFNLERLPLHLAKLDKSNSNYWVPTPIGNPGKSLVGESQTITLTSPILGAKIYYTLNGGFRPSENANLYTQPIKVFVPQGQTKILKTIVIAPSGKRSVVSETALTNPAPAEVKK
jgi:hexosaminidase